MQGINEIKITRSRRRSIAIMVHKDGTVEVRAPKLVPNFVINAFIKSKSEWIKERKAFVLKNKVAPKKFANGERFVFLGREYSLEVGNYTQIELKDDKILFPVALQSKGKVLLEKWYIKQAKLLIKSQLDYYSKKMKLPYKSVMFSDTSSKWGSCTHDNRLQFNWRLIMAPVLVLRYVIIHELTHTIHKNHSKSFWGRVSEENPSFKQQIKWLKSEGHKLRVE